MSTKIEWTKDLPSVPGFYPVILCCPSILVEPRSVVELIEVSDCLFIKFIAGDAPRKAGSEVVHRWGQRLELPEVPSAK